jgi:hypothetical protein
MDVRNFFIICWIYEPCSKWGPLCSAHDPQQRDANPMDLSLPWDPTICTATEEISSNLWNPKVHYSVLKGPPLFPIARKFNAVHITHSIFLSSILILSIYLLLNLNNTLFPSGFPNSNLHASSFPHSCYMTILISSSLTLPFQLYLVKCTSYEAPH